MIERPTYFEHELMPGKRMFACAALSASMTTEACAARWRAARDGEKCHRCPIGRLHAQPPEPARSESTPAPTAPADAATTRRREWFEHSHSGGPCVRCGRGGFRLIGGWICVSCANRSYEATKGRNSKGKPPATYKPLFFAEIGIELQGGRIETWLFEVQHQAEIVARALRIMDRTPGATRVVAAPRPGPSAWNPETCEFEFTCCTCGAQGLVLERVSRDGRLERHRWCCEGDPSGKDWEFAKVRMPMAEMHVDAAAEFMSSDPKLKGERLGMQTPTPYVCTDCHCGQVEGVLSRPGGRWRTQCRSCGSASTETPP